MRFFSTLPVSGFGASPRCMSAEWLRDKTNVAKSTRGNASSPCASGFVFSSTTGPSASLSRAWSIDAPAQGGLRGGDRVRLVAHVGELRDVLLQVLLVEDGLLQVALSHAHVPLPAVDRLCIAARHGRFSFRLIADSGKNPVRLSWHRAFRAPSARGC